MDDTTKNNKPTVEIKNNTIIFENVNIKAQSLKEIQKFFGNNRMIEIIDCDVELEEDTILTASYELTAETFYNNNKKYGYIKKRKAWQ